MFNFCSLYSGSSGNSLFVESKNTKILIDAGVSCKKIEQALQDINVDPSTLDGILVTHEHRDHVQSLGTISKKFDLPVFVNQETLDAMPAQRDKIAEKNIKLFKVDDKFEVGDLLIKPFAIPHDAANPCGFSVYKDKSKISVATDIGHMTNSILKSLEESLFVLLEANYDPKVLQCSSYPFVLKSRIAGPTGHLPNEMAGKTISYLLQSGLKNAMLGHLSKESNFPELAYQTVLDELITTKEYNGSWEFEVPVKKDLSESKNIDIKNIDLNVNIGTEDAGITAILVGILAGILGIIIKKPKYQILPIYANRNLLKINLNGIFTIYLMHYIYKFIKDNIKERFMDKPLNKNLNFKVR